MPINTRLVLLVIFTVLLPWGKIFAQEPTQTEVDESFDPFADYNEFEQQSEEEEDINFLRNGRYLTLAFAGGYRSFLGGGFTQAYKGSFSYGAEFNYFFNLQLAGGISYMTSNHPVSFNSYSDNNLTAVSARYSGSVGLQAIDLHAKYYFNTDNVTKGLADLSPYGVLGTTYFIRNYNLDRTFPITDQVWGFKFGAGIEVPLLKNQAYMGLQFAYRYVQFPDENMYTIDQDNDSDTPANPISPRLDGDIYDITIFLGLNF